MPKRTLESLGSSEIQEMGRYVFSHKLAIGGSILSRSKDGKLIQLTNGLIIKKDEGIDAGNSSIFLQKAIEFSKGTTVNLGNAIHESHIFQLPWKC